MSKSNWPQNGQEALQSSELRYRRLFESAKDGILILDAVSGQIVDVNPFLIQMLGYSKGDLMGKELWEIGVFKDVRGSKAAFVELQQQGYIRYENLPLETRGGLVKQVEFVSNSYLAGEARMIQCNIRDITERKRAEGQLHLQSAALESAANAIMITDEKGKIIWVNPAFTQTTGYSMEEVLGKNPRLVKSGKQDRAFYQDMWDTILSGKVWRNTIINRCKDGTLNHEDLTITPISDTTGKITHFVAIKQDITQLEQALSAVQTKTEELAAMTQQLWQASKLATMGELAASIAHELNNPLATVALRAETLLMQIPEDDQKRRSLEVIMQEVDRMAALVNNLLQFSRRSYRQVSTVDPREEIANSVEFVHYHLRTQKTEVVRDFANPLPTIQADRQQLRQLFLNLLTNASDAMPRGGKLTVRAASGALNDAEAVVIEFADTGEGITAENLEKIWEPFFTTKPEGKGTGLGLAICRRIVEEHGGTIDIQSQAGRGTTIRIVLPATTNGASS
jgi:PAS domain S-box-containing protein